MNRRSLILAAALSAALPLASLAQEIEEVEQRPLSLEELSAYLNSLKTVETTFTQINWDNSISTGQLWLKRPGRIRLEYDAPDAGLLMAIGGSLAIFDKKSNQPPERYPVRRTPLWLLLERNVDLTDQKMVVGHGFDGSHTWVEAMDPKRPEHGSIQLRFTSDPVSLKGWVTFDAHGGNTMVALDAFDQDVEIDNNFFNIQRMILELVPEENR
ncbi:outer membrane lipoprotein carrier protein LolA [Cognatishimia sp.]|uniref:LolA family protein n=1 Tax=Cognatishimia sp. TaxID=2211648 RepID=UPI0035138A8A